MQIDSMISSMRNRSIMKEKQKTNLKLYDEIEEKEMIDFEDVQSCEYEGDQSHREYKEYGENQGYREYEIKKTIPIRATQIEKSQSEREEILPITKERKYYPDLSMDYLEDFTQEEFEWEEENLTEFEDFDELEESDEFEEESMMKNIQKGTEKTLQSLKSLEESEEFLQKMPIEFSQTQRVKELDLDDLFETFSRYMEDLKQEVQENLTPGSPQSVYEEKGIDSNQKSGIFMIDMYRMNLPEELDEKIKHKSVIDILNAFEISQEALEEDAKQRKAALEHYMQLLKQKSGEKISSYRENIRKLEEFIEEINQMIFSIEEFYKAQFKIMKAEQNKIESALKFMKGQDFLKNKLQKKAQTKRSMKKQGEGK